MLLALASGAASAGAAAQFVWFGHGEVLYPAGVFSEAVRSMSPILGDSRPAWKCNHLTVLGAALWSWNCVLVASHPEEVAWSPLPPDIDALVQNEAPPPSAGRSLWNRFGALLLLSPVMLLLRRHRRSRS